MNAQLKPPLNQKFFGANAVEELKAQLGEQDRVLFVRWNSAPRESSWSALEEWIGKLDPNRKLVKLSHGHAPVTDSSVLREFFEHIWARFCPNNLHQARRLDVLSALDRLTYSELLETSVLARLIAAKREAEDRHRLFESDSTLATLPALAIATFDSGPEANQRVRRVLGWIRQLELPGPVIVFGRERPSGEGVEEYRFSRDSLFKDVSELLGSLDFAREAGATEAPGSQYQRILEVLSAAVTKLLELGNDQKKATIHQAQNWQTIQEEWAYLIARLAAPNFSVVREIAVSWNQLEQKIEEWSDELEQLGWLRPDNAEEYYTFRVRLVFLVLLRALYPEIYRAAAHETDGADNLYRFHLILLGEANTDSLVASALMPHWNAWLNEPLVCELFQSCFNPIRGGFPLVPRYESRLQLRNLLLWLSEHSTWPDRPPRNDALSSLVKLHRDWVAKVANTHLDDKDPLPSYDEIRREARKLLDSKSAASDALQAAQILLSIDELNGESLNKHTFDELVTTAIRSSSGGIWFDAILTQARSLAMNGKPDAALQILRIEKRKARDPLMRLAADIEIAFVHECEGDLFRAVTLYQPIIREAEDAGADELLARAVSGCLRCDKMTKRSPSTRNKQLRAQIMLRIQSARSTELSPLSKRDKPKLFLSYRSNQRFLTRCVHEGLVSTQRLDTYYDQVKEEGDDFGPAIHTSLLDSDAVVLLLSEEFFDSPWCIHELHFALGQCEVRGVMLFWVWCAEGGEPAESRCEEAVRDWIDRRFPFSPLRRNGYERSHVEDRVNRLFSYGRCLADKVVIFDSKAADQAAERKRLTGILVQPITNYTRRLYERAHLPYPEGDPPGATSPTKAE